MLTGSVARPVACACVPANSQAAAVHLVLAMTIDLPVGVKSDSSPDTTNEEANSAIAKCICRASLFKGTDHAVLCGSPPAPAAELRRSNQKFECRPRATVDQSTPQTDASWRVLQWRGQVARAKLPPAAPTRI